MTGVTYVVTVDGVTPVTFVVCFRWRCWSNICRILLAFVALRIVFHIFLNINLEFIFCILNSLLFAVTFSIIGLQFFSCWSWINYILKLLKVLPVHDVAGLRFLFVLRRMVYFKCNFCGRI